MLRNKKTDALINLRVCYSSREIVYLRRKIDKTEKTLYTNSPSYISCLKWPYWTISQDKKRTLSLTYVNDY